jgi:hypothetical protein
MVPAQNLDFSRGPRKVSILYRDGDPSSLHGCGCTNGHGWALGTGMCCVRGICGQGENHKGIAANELNVVGGQVRNLG